MPTKKIITKRDIDNFANMILRKSQYNAKVNKLIKPFKDELKKLAVSKTFTYEWFDGYKKSVKLQKVSVPYVDLEKLKANPKDYKKYVKYNPQYRLTASNDKMGLKEVA
tara:strand:- start:28 stop:354 length:327 start_codon:yes stop_codon:yes gene_type:complete